MLKIRDKHTGNFVSEHDLLPSPKKCLFVVVYGINHFRFDATARLIAGAARGGVQLWKMRDRVQELQSAFAVGGAKITKFDIVDGQLTEHDDRQDACFMAEINFGDTGLMSDEDTRDQLQSLLDLLADGKQVIASIHASNPIERLSRIAKNVGMHPGFMDQFKSLLTRVGWREIGLSTDENNEVTVSIFDAGGLKVVSSL